MSRVLGGVAGAASPALPGVKSAALQGAQGTLHRGLAATHLAMRLRVAAGAALAGARGQRLVGALGGSEGGDERGVRPIELRAHVRPVEGARGAAVGASDRGRSLGLAASALGLLEVVHAGAPCRVELADRV